MNQFLTFVIGAVVGGFIVRLFAKQSREREEIRPDFGVLKKQLEEKEENKKRIINILRTQNSLTNNHIEQLLGVSDATATRYLEELEKEGLIRQVGKTGHQVYYEKV